MCWNGCRCNEVFGDEIGLDVVGRIVVSDEVGLDLYWTGGDGR